MPAPQFVKHFFQQSNKKKLRKAPNQQQHQYNYWFNFLPVAFFSFSFTAMVFLFLSSFLSLIIFSSFKIEVKQKKNFVVRWCTIMNKMINLIWILSSLQREYGKCGKLLLLLLLSSSVFHFTVFDLNWKFNCLVFIIIHCHFGCIFKWNRWIVYNKLSKRLENNKSYKIWKWEKREYCDNLNN